LKRKHMYSMRLYCNSNTLTAERSLSQFLMTPVTAGQTQSVWKEGLAEQCDCMQITFFQKASVGMIDLQERLVEGIDRPP